MTARFKIADLVLDIGPMQRAKICRLNTIMVDPCRIFRTCYIYFSPCHPILSWCKRIGTVTPKCPIEEAACAAGSIFPVTPEIFEEWDDPRELLAIKEELGTIMVELDKRVEVLNKEMQPQTLDEVEALTTALKAAQAELTKRRKELGGA